MARLTWYLLFVTVVPWYFYFAHRFTEALPPELSSFDDGSDETLSSPVNSLRTKPKYNPVLFVPGDGGSQLEAKLNKTYRLHYICDEKSDWYDIWLNIHLLAPVAFDCFSDNMRLHYNRSTRTTQNTQGVEIRPAKFGRIDGMDYLDVLRLHDTDYFDQIISTLEKVNGFTRNVDMVGAGFDFRKAPNELGQFFNNLTQLIEEHYVRNRYKPVTLICHSMGCLNTVHLLNRMSNNWKAVHIRRLISLGAPWSGSLKAITAMLYGDNLGIPLLNSYKLQALQSTFPSLMYLFPRLPAFEKQRPLVQTSEKNYTLNNLDELFNEARLFDQLEMWRDTREIAANLSAPNVELWCLFGYGVETPSKIIYQGTIDSNTHTEMYSDGDGTVNLESLRACEQFKSQQKKPVYLKQFNEIDHIHILRNPVVANFISGHIIQQDLAS